MFRVNDLLGKTVINQATGERLAKIDDVVFSQDMRAVIALLISGQGWFAQPCVVRWGAVQSIGDVVVTRSEAPLPRLSDDPMIAGLRDQNHKLSGTPLIGGDGQRVGAITNTLIDDRGSVLGFEVDPGGLFIGRKFLPIAQVQTVGKDAIIASDTTLRDRSDAEATKSKTVG